jgi:ribosomal protein L11
MKKKHLTWKLQLPPGQARPGQKLAFLGKNAMKFCRGFNEQTKEIES